MKNFWPALTGRDRYIDKYIYAETTMLPRLRWYGTAFQTVAPEENFRDGFILSYGLFRSAVNGICTDFRVPADVPCSYQSSGRCGYWSCIVHPDAQVHQHAQLSKQQYDDEFEYHTVVCFGVTRPDGALHKQSLSTFQLFFSSFLQISLSLSPPNPSRLSIFLLLLLFLHSVTLVSTTSTISRSP